HNFEIKEETGKIQVYTDKRWLVYLLDQLIQNAVKYRSCYPFLAFKSVQEEQGSVTLYVEDNGLGIAPEDLPYIFRKGFVGKNHRKGDYRSTGMGLYFVKEICELLHIESRVFSEPGKSSRFEFRFQNLSEHLLLYGYPCTCSVSFSNVRYGQKLSGRCKDIQRPLCYAGIQTGGNIEMNKILEIRNLSKSYGRRGYQTWVLRDISLDIFQGDFIGIM